MERIKSHEEVVVRNWGQRVKNASSNLKEWWLEMANQHAHVVAKMKHIKKTCSCKSHFELFEKKKKIR
jgi:hypothetical protein